MLTENQKNCKHEWSIKHHECRLCVVSSDDWSNYQQGFNEGIDEAIKFCDKELSLWKEAKERHGRYDVITQDYRTATTNVIVLTELKSALEALKKETKSG